MGTGECLECNDGVFAGVGAVRFCTSGTFCTSILYVGTFVYVGYVFFKKVYVLYVYVRL